MEQRSLKHKKTKASKCGSMKIQSIVFVTLVSLALISVHSVNVQAQIANGNDLVVLSHRFEDSRFSSEIIGEVLNNDTRSYDKFDIDIYANFRDSAGMLVSSEQGFIDAEELGPGQSSAFNVFVFGDDIADRASAYDLIINDERLVTGQPLDEEFVSNSSSNGNNDDDDDNDDNDNDNDNDEQNLIQCPPGSTLRDGKCISPYSCPAVVGTDCEPGEGEISPITDEEQEPEENDNGDESDSEETDEGSTEEEEL